MPGVGRFRGALKAAAALGVLALAACGGPAAAPEAELSRLSLPAGPPPGDIVSDGQGGFWLARGYALARLSPEGALSEVSLPAIGIVGDIARASDGAIWYSQAGRLGRIAADGSISEFPLPGDPHAAAQGLAAAPDGAIWFTIGELVGDNQYEGRIGRLSPSGDVAVVNLPDQFVTPQDIAAAADSSAWFSACWWNTDRQSCTKSMLGRVTPAGAIETFPLQDEAADPRALIIPQDGPIWFAARGADAVGRFDPQTQAQTYSPLSEGAQPTDLAPRAAGGVYAAGVGVFAIAADATATPDARFPGAEVRGLIEADGGALYVVEGGSDGGAVAWAPPKP